ncbi:hypothetical protein HY251_13500 [bacterium]|nr:hypothetical protein [bacterium]
MLVIYETALAVGGVLLLASLVMGHHGVDHGGGISADHSMDAGHGDAHGGGAGPFFLFLSMRFWTFAADFFGLTGVLFTKLNLAGDDTRVVLAIAAAIGLGCGVFAAWILARLRNQVVNSLPTEMSYVGLTAEVLLEVTPEEPGRIRLSSRGSLIDLPARCDGGERLPKGSQALVVDVTDGVACVSPAPSPRA